MVRREKHYVGRREMEIKVQGKRKRIWLNKVKDDIKEKGPVGEEGAVARIDDRASWRRMSSHIDPTSKWC